MFGYDTFNDIRTANNHQSGSDYRILSAGAILSGSGAGENDLSPIFLGDGTTTIQWNPILEESEGSSFRTHSGFVNDTWRISDRLTANVGIRFDKNDGADQSGNVVAKDSAWSPRLGVIWDPTGNGAWSVTGSVAKYVAAISNPVADSSAAGGNPQTRQFIYRGASINGPGTTTPVPTAQAIRSVFDWFFANGGPNPAAQRRADDSRRHAADRRRADVAERVGIRQRRGAPVRTRAHRCAPTCWCGTTSTSTCGRPIRRRAACRIRPAAPSTWRSSRTRPTGCCRATMPAERSPAPTASGERSTSAATTRCREPGATSTPRTWPADRCRSTTATRSTSRRRGTSPTAISAVDQRHRARLWANYSPDFVPGLTLSVLQALESGVPYGAVNTNGVDPRPYVTNPNNAYLTPPASTVTTYFFGPRDEFHTEGQLRTDFAVNYVYRVPGAGRMQLFAQLQVLNVFNQFQLCACGSTVFGTGSAANAGGVNLQRLDTTVLTPGTTASRFCGLQPVHDDAGPRRELGLRPELRHRGQPLRLHDAAHDQDVVWREVLEGAKGQISFLAAMSSRGRQCQRQAASAPKRGQPCKKRDLTPSAFTPRQDVALEVREAECRQRAPSEQESP